MSHLSSYGDIEDKLTSHDKTRKSHELIESMLSEEIAKSINKSIIEELMRLRKNKRRSDSINKIISNITFSE
jgi:hypothetical protein